MSDDKTKAVEPYYRRVAKEVVTFLFDKRFLNDDLSRESIEVLEDYFAYLIESYCNAAVRIERLTAKMREPKAESTAT